MEWIKIDISIKEITKEHLHEYSKIPMWFRATSKYELDKIDGGLGGIVFNEIDVDNEIMLIWYLDLDKK